MAAFVRDSSIGGKGWEEFDTFLMSIRRHEVPARPSPSFEYFYGWIEWDATTQGAGAKPGFFGHAGGKRTDSTAGVPNWRIWDAATTVQGVSNIDTTATGLRVADTSWTTEFKFNLALRGYNVKAPAGDIVEMTITMSDADWHWPDRGRASATWNWVQGRWGGDPFYNVLRIYVRPDVTTTSGPAPTIPPDVVIPNGGNHARPVIDGALDESVWRNIPGLQLKYGDAALRATYPGIGPYRSGWVQPRVAGTEAAILDPASAKVKYFFRGDTIYFGFDVADQLLTRGLDPNLREWVRVTVNHRDSLNADKVLQPLELTVTVVDTGPGYVLGGYLPTLAARNAAWVGVKTKGSFTDFVRPDTGYTVEMAVDLKGLGYPAGRGDGVLFFGVSVHDGDSVTAAGQSYANRVWFFRVGADREEAAYRFGTAPAWAYMDPRVNVPTAIEKISEIPTSFALLGNYPNPFNPSTVVRYTLPEPGTVKLYVFDVLGRKAATLDHGFQLPGTRQLEFNASGLSSGTYFYYLEMVSANTKSVSRTASAKMLLVK
jgi:hypothetical protein